MDFIQTIHSNRFVLTEGAMIERVRRDPVVVLDPHVATANLVYTPEGRAVLSRLYRQYLDVGRAHDLPIIVLTPTWRASPARLRDAGLGDVAAVNGECVRFLQTIRDGYGSYAASIFIGGLMGTLGNAYDPDIALPAAEAVAYHRPQARALASTGVDFLMAATLPAFSEALGMARAMAETGVPYIPSFVLRPSGTLLDGMPLHEAVAGIDAAVSPRPLAYMANCVHPTVFASALARELAQDATLGARIIGLQANTSARSPEELLGLDHLETEAPDALAAAMYDVYRRFGMRVLGGCCGTDERHIAAIADVM